MGFRVGPGSYDIKFLRKRPGAPKIKRLTVDDDNTEYMYVGDALVPTYFNNKRKISNIVKLKNDKYFLSH
jgi:hypothetical protein